MKIAVITNGVHFDMGGVEKYSSLLYEYFSHEHEIVEFPTLSVKKNKLPDKVANEKITINYSLLGWKPHLIVWGGAYTRKNYNNIFNNFDLVIINAMFVPAKWISHPKVILVQHMNKDWYQLNWKKPLISLGKLINYFLFKVSTITNPFKGVKNAVFFAEETAAFTKGKKFYLPLAHKNQNDIKLTNYPRQGFVWISRLDNHQKNVKAIVRLANINPDINIYGMGHSKNIINKSLINQNQYKGYVSKNEVDNILQQTKALIITSNFEGFPFSAVEALSNGTPIILFDTFDAAKFFATSEAVFLIPKGDIKSLNEKISWIRNLNAEDYQKLSEKAIKFAQTNFSKESFWVKWIQLINNFKKLN